jgi:toxin ParE1/3/4
LSRRRERWDVRLTAAAEADLRQIVRWTADHFGARQARAYATTLSHAIEALTADPDVVGARSRDDIARRLCSLQVARGGRKGRHLVLFRASSDRDQRTIEVLRVLHDSMDLPQQVPVE